MDDEDVRHANKRQRVSQACEGCRKKKIKCDGNKPTCTNCGNSGAECVYTQVPRKPRAPKKRSANIGELENRLDRIESLLEALAPGRNMPNGRRDENDSNSNNNGAGDYDFSQPNRRDDYYSDNEGNNEEESYSQDEDLPGMANDHFIKLRVDPNSVSKDADIFSVSVSRETSHYCTNGTIFAILSHGGMKWVSDTTSDASVPDRVSKMFSDIHLEHFERMRPFVVEQGQMPALPSREMLDFAWKLLNSERDTWDTVIQLDDLESIFQALTDNSKPKNGYAEYLLIFAVCALVVPFAPILSENSDLTTIPNGQGGFIGEDEARDLQLKYCVGALFFFHRVFFLPPTMTALRGFVLLLFSMRCSNFHPITALTPVACRFAIELGLHRKESCRGKEPDEANRMRRLFWAVYCIDRDTAMKIGRSPTIMDYDITTSYPSPISEKDAEFAPDVKLSQLMKIYGDVYDSLYSAKATSSSPAELAKHVARLDQVIQNWRESLPVQYRPNADFADDTPGKIDSFPTKSWYSYWCVLDLHLTYYQLMSNIHRVTAYHPSWISAAVNSENNSSSSSPASNNNTTNTSAQSPNNQSTPNSQYGNGYKTLGNKGKFGRLYASLDICVASARSTVEMLRSISNSDERFLAGALFYCANSFITLFIKCLARPGDLSTNYDLDHMSFQLDLFDTFEAIARPPHKSKADCNKTMTEFWRVLYDIAKSYVERTQSACKPPSHATSKSIAKLSDVRSNPQQQQPDQVPNASNGYLPPNNPSVAVNSMYSPLKTTQDMPQVYPNTTHQSSGATPAMHNPFEDPFQDMDASVAQSLYQVSSYFYSWDPEFMGASEIIPNS